MKSKNFDACEEMLAQMLVMTREMLRDINTMVANVEAVKAHTKTRKAAKS